jgi:hypothetical protein
MTESGQRALVTFKGDPICLMKYLKKILASQTSHPSIEKRMLAGRVEQDCSPLSISVEPSPRQAAGGF